MAHGFRRQGKGAAERFTAKLDPSERDLLVSLLSQTHDLLDPPDVSGGPDVDAFTALTAPLAGLPGFAAPRAMTPEPAVEDDRDPALARLLPSAHRTDEAAAAEFRRLTEAGLRRRKADTIETAITGLRRNPGGIDLDRPTAIAVLTALTDVRLVLGERMGLQDDVDVERVEERASQLPDVAVYDFLTWLQETLAHALLRTRR